MQRRRENIEEEDSAGSDEIKKEAENKGDKEPKTLQFDICAKEESF